MLMDLYIKKLRQYIADNPIQFDYDCDHPALDSLYWHYTESHSLSNDKTKQADAVLNACLEELPLKDNDKVFGLLVTLCAEHERIAFLAGLQVGAQLILEITDGPGNE